MGRNMFGPVRGPWPNDEWQGWWGANPPYHVPVFVLTHHARAPLEMEGGTVFHFVMGGIGCGAEAGSRGSRERCANRGAGLLAGSLPTIELGVEHRHEIARAQGVFEHCDRRSTWRRPANPVERIAGATRGPRANLTIREVCGGLRNRCVSAVSGSNS